MSNTQNEWPLWEVFVRPKAGLDHKHCGSLHAPDPKMALQGMKGAIAKAEEIVASDPADKDMLFDPAEDKVYRHPTFYELPEAVNHM